MIAYKLFRVLKNGEITSLFINKCVRLSLDEWLEAEEHPTQGFTFRPKWHCTEKPEAPHLSLKNRAWYKVEIEGITELQRPAIQGGVWYLADKLKILQRVL